MILVDIGNSGLRAARVSEDQAFSNEPVFRLSWSAAVASYRKPSPEQESAPNQKWCTLSDSHSFDWLVSQFEAYPGDEWFISCVQRTALVQLETSLKMAGMTGRVRIVGFSDLPIKISVLEPDKTGIDRLLAGWAAHTIVKARTAIGEALIVVQAGTAVTVDLIAADGEFCGGAIMPGLGLALQLLAAGTDQLPWLGNHVVDSEPELPGKNTSQAISAGVNAALVGGASHIVHRYRKTHGDSLKVIVTGGDGPLLLPHIPTPSERIDHLVLRGLSLLAKS